MVWKLFVMLMFWEITGAVLYWSLCIKWMWKIQKLDPNNDEMIYEALDMMSFGIFDTKKRKEETDDQRGKRITDCCENLTGEPLLLTHLKSYFVWPKIIAQLAPFMQEAYETLKSEYDRGIRTRKEGPVSQ